MLSDALSYAICLIVLFQTPAVQLAVLCLRSNFNPKWVRRSDAHRPTAHYSTRPRSLGSAPGPLGAVQRGGPGWLANRCP